MVRIAAVTTWFPTSRAPSSGIFAAQDAAAIAAHPRIERLDVVHLVAPRLAGGVRVEHRDGMRVLRVPMAPGNPLDLWRVSRELRDILADADIVHSMAISSLAPLALLRPHQPWIHTEHWSGLTSPETLNPLLRGVLPMARALLRAPDTVTAVCDYLARPIRRVRYPRRTAVIGCIVPPLESPAARPIRPPARLHLVSVGGLVERKDPLVAIETVAEVQRRGQPARLTWVGEGPLRDAARAMASRLGVDLTLTGTLDTSGVGAALDAADLFLLPTRGDNFCVSAAEALVHGRPVVVGARGGQGEYIQELAGSLVRRRDPQAYADAVLATMKRTAHLTASQIADTIGDRFSAAKVADCYVREYEHLRLRWPGRRR